MIDLKYDRDKLARARRELAISAGGRDITATYPDEGDLATRDACSSDLERFLTSYFPHAFPLAWSRDHRRVIERLRECLTVGGHFAMAMPRGSGKTTVSIRAALWALLYGHRRFVSIIGATEKHAEMMLKQLKHELIYNERLAADFREVCHPLQCLENNARRQIGQLFDGAPTRIEWGADRLTFPTMPEWACHGTPVSGSTVSVAGLTGALRGQSHSLPDGRVIRPEVAILDDPQTREAAMSPAQTASRTAIIKGDVLGMAGPGRDIAAIMPCTVIREGDLASEMLDRERNPEWGGQLTKMVYSFPSETKMWDEYGRLRAEGLKADRGGGEATEFYRANRAAMDAGAVVAWPERFKAGSELSAVQHAMNLLLLDRRAFFAEYQNEPLPEESMPLDVMTADQIAAKVNGHARGLVPAPCHLLTAFIDVHATVLYYSVVGWEEGFGGYVVDYGTFPDQKQAYYTLGDARITLDQVVKAAGVEGRIYAGLEALTALILGREWKRDDGTTLRVERCLIDANWGQQSDVVYRFCRQSPHAAILTPSHGKGIGASSTPIPQYQKRPGERIGLNWYMPTESRGRRVVRKVIFDANFWKSFVHARLAVAMGDKGCLSLWGDRPQAHKLYADHLTAERPIPTHRQGSSRVVDEWKWNVGRPDNHFLDCLTGACVAASMQGVALIETTTAAKSAAAAGPNRFAAFRERMARHQGRR